MQLKKIIIVSIAIFFSISLSYNCASGFTRKLVADYQDQDADNISYYVVLYQKNLEDWVRVEMPFEDVCADGTCTMEIELDPESEYVFQAFFSNDAGDGEAAWLSYETGRVEPVESNSPELSVEYIVLSKTQALITGAVTDESHVDVRMSGIEAIQNLGYSDFSFEVDIYGSTPIVLEAIDIHGNSVVMNVNIIPLSGFDKDYYLEAKLAALQAVDPDWIGEDVEHLESVLLSLGLSAESHYSQYGYLEGIEPNAYFNHSEYMLAKADSLYASGGYTSAQDALAAFIAAWPWDAYQHYILYGAAEGINPSNRFDETAYLSDKLAALRDEGNEWGYASVDELRAYLASLGLTVISHYLDYGINEGLVPMGGD